MRNIFIPILFFAVFALLSCKNCNDDVVIPPTTMMPDHPRILWGTDEEQAIKTAIAVSGSWQKKYTILFRPNAISL